MTVKQFAYLATGVVFAWILLQLPINILIKFPFCAIFALLGIGLAYFPVSGRPMDIMIGNYLKAFIRPTQFIYEKTGGQIYFPGKMAALAVKPTQQYQNSFSPFPKDKLKAYLQTINTVPKNKIDEKEEGFLMSVSNLGANKIHYQEAHIPTLHVQPIISQPQTPIQVQIPPIPQPVVATPPAPAKTQPTMPLAPPPTIQQPAPTQPIKIITGKFKPADAPSAPEFPNLITGITRDARGNALSNILVEVKDKDGNPVRAFKTNGVGRFASATPLANGTYAVEFEDPKGQNKFEQMTINVSGQIITPITATSVDTREELRRSLFATSAPGGTLKN